MIQKQSKIKRPSNAGLFNTNEGVNGFFFQPLLKSNLAKNENLGKADAATGKVIRTKAVGSNYFFGPELNIYRKCAECEKDEQQMFRKEDRSKASFFKQQNSFSSADSFFRAELDQDDQSGQPVPTDKQQSSANTAECSYNVEYGNARLLPVSACGGQIQFDILQVKSSNKKCQKEVKGKQLSEVVTTDNNCVKTTVTTGPPVALGDYGFPVTPATDTYGINMPRNFAIDCKYGIPCPQEMKQQLFVDGKLATTNIIRFEMCGDSGGCLTKIYINDLYHGKVGTGIYQNLSSQPY